MLPPPLFRGREKHPHHLHPNSAMSIQSVKRASQILSLFSKARTSLGSTEISKELGIHKATAQGLVRTLWEEGFLSQNPETRKYRLGLKIYELGMVPGQQP